MVNCNPETVSTDYDTVDRLYFEPLTFEDVSAIVERRQERAVRSAASIQVHGRTLIDWRCRCSAPASGSSARHPTRSILPKTASGFAKLLWDLGIPQAPSGTATSIEEGREVASSIGFPLVVRPSYVLGGRAMAIVYDMPALDRYMTHAVSSSPGASDPDRQVPRGRRRARRGRHRRCHRRRDHRRDHGAHRRPRGIHSGDSSCVVPPFKVVDRHVEQIRDYTRRIARALKVVGLMDAAGLRSRTTPSTSSK